jgi:hypothetical protein
MKKIILAGILFSMSIGAFSEERKFDDCLQLSEVWTFSASAHEIGKSPQEALAYVRSAPNLDKFPADQMKNIINNVFFNPDLQGISSNNFYDQVMSSCLNPPPQYEPLK